MTKTTSRTPRLLRKVKIDGTWVLQAVAKIGDKYDWDRVLVDGRPQVVSEVGSFYLEYWDRKKKVRKSVGTKPREVMQALATQANVLDLRRQGVEVGDAPQIGRADEPEGLSLLDGGKKYFKEKHLRLRDNSVTKYKECFTSFRSWTDKSHVVQVDRGDILEYVNYLVDDESLAVRTAVNKASNVLTILRALGSPIVMEKGDWPKWSRKERLVYTAEVLKPLFAGMDKWDFTLYQIFLQSGFRDKEMCFLGKTDFLPKQKKLRVTSKLHLGFEPKTYEERTVPISTFAVDLLQQHLARWEGHSWFDNSELMFPTETQLRDDEYAEDDASADEISHKDERGRQGGLADRKMLRRLKRIAKRQNLNCGHCDATWEGKPVTCRTHAVCKKFGLHMFRHTYATTLLRDGTDIPTLQQLLGHKDVASTMIYLRALQPEMAQEKIERSSLASLGV